MAAKYSENTSNVLCIIICIETGLPIAVFVLQTHRSTDGATAKSICFQSLALQEMPTLLSLSLSPDEESPSSCKQ